jgi:hypothetical protein
MKWEKEQVAKKEEREARYKWKLKPPKDEESTTKKVMMDGKQRHIIGVNTIDYGHSIHQRNVRGNPPESTRQEKELQEEEEIFHKKEGIHGCQGSHISLSTS